MNTEQARGGYERMEDTDYNEILDEGDDMIDTLQELVTHWLEESKRAGVTFHPEKLPKTLQELFDFTNFIDSGCVDVDESMDADKEVQNELLAEWMSFEDDIFDWQDLMRRSQPPARA